MRLVSSSYIPKINTANNQHSQLSLACMSDKKEYPECKKEIERERKKRSV